MPTSARAVPVGIRASFHRSGLTNPVTRQPESVVPRRVASVLRSGDRDPSAGGETHERSIHSGCSPEVRDRATELVVTGAPDRQLVKGDSYEHNTFFGPAQHLADGLRRHRTGARRRRARVGPRWWRLDRQRVADRRYRWAVRCRAGRDHSRLDHRDVRRRDGRGPDSWRGTDRATCRNFCRCPQARTSPVGSDPGRVPIRPAAGHLERLSDIIASAENAADMRRRMGAAALEMDAASDRWTGACSSRRRSTNYARAVAGSKRSSRTATPGRCSAPMRWTCRCVRLLLEPATTKVELLPSSSPDSGADDRAPRPSSSQHRGSRRSDGTRR